MHKIFEMQFEYKLDEIDKIAEHVMKQLNSVVVFYGGLGAGKTTLIKALIKTMGGDTATSSPTFSLVNEYQTAKGKVYHLDLYRIESQEEALDLGVEEHLYGDAQAFIEWPQVIEELLPADHTIIEISGISSDQRMLKIMNNSPRSNC